MVILKSWQRPRGGLGGGGLLGSIFPGYVLLASQNPYPFIVYFWSIWGEFIESILVTFGHYSLFLVNFVASYRPHLSHFWANNFLIPKVLKKCNPILVTLLKMLAVNMRPIQQHIPSGPLLESTPPPRGQRPTCSPKWQVFRSLKERLLLCDNLDKKQRATKAFSCILDLSVDLALEKILGKKAFLMHQSQIFQKFKCQGVAWGGDVEVSI